MNALVEFIDMLWRVVLALALIVFLVFGAGCATRDRSCEFILQFPDESMVTINQKEGTRGFLTPNETALPTTEKHANIRKNGQAPILIETDCK